MHHILKSHHPIRHVKSFKYVFEGILHALLNEANFRVQVVVTAFVAFLGFHFSIKNTEWGLLIISMGMLLSAELLNTVVEEFIDFVIKENHVTAKIIKDLAAGFVLLTAITALFIIFLIFGDKIALYK